MFFRRCISVLAAVLFSFSTVGGVDDDTVLKLVHVSFRHGDRTPELVDFYPTDPYLNRSFFPLKNGQLTNIGKLHEFELGEALRRRYNAFLGTSYYPELVEMWSTDFDRTKMSALLVLAGLFKPTANETWNEDLPWLPIPYRYKPQAEDTWLKRPNDYCPEYMNELNIVKSTIQKEIIRNNSEFLEYLSNNTGKKFETILDAFHLYQGFLAKESMNLPLPEWTNTVFPEPLGSFAAQQCYLESYNEKLRRLNGGNILRKFLHHSNLYVKGELKPEGRKIYLYSGHEINAINVQAALNMYDPPHFPGYGSALLFELHQRKRDKEFGFKIFYRNGTKDEFRNLLIPSCGSFCPYNQFLKIAEPIIPKNYTAECGASTDIHTFTD